MSYAHLTALGADDFSATLEASSQAEGDRLLAQGRAKADATLASAETSLLNLAGKRAGIGPDEVQAVRGLWNGIRDGKINFSNVDAVADKISTQVAEALPSVAVRLAEEGVSQAAAGNLDALKFGKTAANLLAGTLTTAVATPVLGPLAPMAGLLATKICASLLADDVQRPSAAAQQAEMQRYLGELNQAIDKIVASLNEASCYGDPSCAKELRAEVEPLVKMAWLRSPYAWNRDQSLFLSLNSANIARIVTRARFRAELTFLQQVQAAADKMVATFEPQCPKVVRSCGTSIRSQAWKVAFDVATTAQRKDFGAAQAAENGLLILASEVAKANDLAGVKRSQWSSARTSAGIKTEKQMASQRKKASLALNALMEQQRQAKKTRLALQLTAGVVGTIAIGLVGYAVATSRKVPS